MVLPRLLQIPFIQQKKKERKEIRKRKKKERKEKDIEKKKKNWKSPDVEIAISRKNNIHRNKSHAKISFNWFAGNMIAKS